MKLGEKDLIDIAYGGCFLGGGGGGALDTALGLIKSFSKKHSAGWEVNVVSVDEARKFAQKDNQIAAVSAFGGPPSTAGSSLTHMGAVHALRRLNDITKNQMNSEVGFVVPIEAGAGNLVTACLVALESNLCVVDADGAGRSMPSMAMSTFAGAQVSINPTVMSNEEGHSIVLAFDDINMVGKLFGNLVASGAFPKAAGLALWPMRHDQMAEAIPIHGTLTHARELGRLIRAGGENLVEKVTAYVGGQGRTAIELFSGDIKEARLSVVEGHDIGSLILEGHRGEEARVYFTNENFIAWRASTHYPLAIAPDSICYLTTKGVGTLSNALLSEKVQKHDPGLGLASQTQAYNLKDLDTGKVHVIGLSADDAIVKDKDVYSVFKGWLQRMGYAGAYVPLKKLHNL